MEQGYNGWTNRATWNVALWLDNDEGMYLAFIDAKESLNSYRDFEDFCREIMGEETPDGDKLNDADFSELYYSMVVDD